MMNFFPVYKKVHNSLGIYILSQMKVYMVSLRSNEEMSNTKDDVLDEIHTMMPIRRAYDARSENLYL